MKILTLLTLLISSPLMATDCTYTIPADGIELKWTAFKTPEKVGVGGTFAELGLNQENYTGKSLAEAISQIKFNIDTSSVRTKNTGRDATIVKWFFQQIPGGMSFTGNLKDYSDKTLSTALTVNKISKDIVMSAETKEKIVTAKAKMKLGDYKLLEALASLNKACFELHKGKTWDDVDLNLNLPYTKTCK